MTKPTYAKFVLICDLNDGFLHEYDIFRAVIVFNETIIQIIIKSMNDVLRLLTCNKCKFMNLCEIYIQTVDT